MKEGAFAECMIVPTKRAIPVPSIKPQFLTLPVSGATAYIGLKGLGELSEGQKIMVTATAGGTGQFAGQLAKAAGCHVIGTCFSDEKVRFLKSIGCDRPVNYKSEDTTAVLQKESPEGLDVVYESVGGRMFKLAIDHLAVKGRLLVIGLVSSYQSFLGLKAPNAGNLPLKLLQRSASVRGFFMPQNASHYQTSVTRLLGMNEKGELVCEIDQRDQAPEGRFVVRSPFTEQLITFNLGKNIEKIVAELPQPVSTRL
ncbi:LOW QUALITY PROTEIN: prostaglandin reductase-3-like [Heptranchias perlo]|uniref:LOW QUALITY PROTEIN: prostaglandin reductase-3-like n=1 Tax=Heptranchias perlo TaxID=212740 RepID=UPI003559A4D9